MKDGKNWARESKGIAWVTCAIVGWKLERGCIAEKGLRAGSCTKMLIGGAEWAYVPNVQVRICGGAKSVDLVGGSRVGAGQGPLLGAGKIRVIRPCSGSSPTLAVCSFCWVVCEGLWNEPQ